MTPEQLQEIRTVAQSITKQAYSCGRTGDAPDLFYLNTGCMTVLRVAVPEAFNSILAIFEEEKGKYV